MSLAEAVSAASKLSVREAMSVLGVETLCLDSFVSVAQAAKIVGVHTDTIRRNFKLARLSRGRVGIRLRTLFEEIEKRSAA